MILLLPASSRHRCDTDVDLRRASRCQLRLCLPEGHLGLLHIVLLHASSADAVSTLSFLKAQMLIRLYIIFGPMNVLLKDRIGLESFEFGLKAVESVAMSAAVGATTGVGEVITIVLGFVTRSSPGDLSSA